MAHEHLVVDTDGHFTIDKATRAISSVSGFSTLMQYDHNSERLTFEIPKEIDGHDMTKCNRVEVHYINIEAITKQTSADVYRVTDMQVSEEDENIVVLSWLISGNATRYAGALTFVIKFKCIAEDGSVDYSWSTARYEGLSVSDGIDNGETIAENYADILSEWEARLEALEQDNNDLTERVTALEEAKVGEGEGGSMTSFVSTEAELLAALTDNDGTITLTKNAVIEISREYVIPANTHIIGNNAQLVRKTGFEGKMLILSSGCKVSNLRIDGNRESMVSPTWDKTKEIVAGERCVIEDVTIENGNEAINCYGNEVLVTHCKITNCGGNGVHFSSSNRTRVENCTIIGANKRTGMGHEGGCISWSMDCDYVICENNYLEDGLSGLGYIKYHTASHLKIVGNTVKNCTYGVDSTYTGLSYEVISNNILIGNNHFIDCTYGVNINNANPTAGNKARNVVISNNIVENGSISVISVAGLIVDGNVITNGRVNISYSPNIIVSNNNITNIETSEKTTVYLDNCPKAKITNNKVRAKNYAVYLAGSSFSTITDNTLTQFPASAGNYYGIFAYAGNSPTKGLIITGNHLFMYCGTGIMLHDGYICANNTIDCSANNVVAIRLYGGRTGTIASNNLSNGNFAISPPTDGKVENNLALPVTDFLGITLALENLTCSGVSKVLNGDTYTGTLTPTDGYTLPETISVEIGGTATTDFTYDNTTGIVTIPKVAGELSITATAI